MTEIQRKAAVVLRSGHSVALRYKEIRKKSSSRVAESSGVNPRLKYFVFRLRPIISISFRRVAVTRFLLESIKRDRSSSHLQVLSSDLHHQKLEGSRQSPRANSNSSTRTYLYSCWQLGGHRPN